MTKYNFKLRLNCTYSDSDNNVDQLDVEVLNDDEWQTLDLNIGCPGFLLFNYGLFACQHLYFRTNAAERGLLMASSKGNIEIHTDSDWVIQSLRVDFCGRLKSGEAKQESIDYIIDRMGHCPVSTNLKMVVDSKTIVTFE